MDLFQQNMNYLKRNHPNLWEKVKSADIDFSDFEIIEFKQSLYNVLHYGKNDERSYLYENNEFDSEMITISENSKEYRFFIGLGLGLGYLYLPLIKEKFVKEILIIEPDIRIFMIYLHLYNVEDILGNEKVIFMLGGDDEQWIKQMLVNYEHIFDHAVSFIITGYYKKHYKESFLDFINAFEKNYVSYISDRCTIDVFIRQYIDNTLKNIYNQIPRSSNLNCMYNIYQQIPAVIVGAGPSLNKQIELLKQLQGKAVIFGVGSAINVLERHQIKPTFRVAIDTSEMEATYFNKLADKSVDLIYFSILNEKCFKEYTGDLYYGTPLINRNIVSFLEEQLELDAQAVFGGGSVSVFATDIASKLGCSPIILIGQDLAFPNLETYAAGAVNERKMDVERDRLIKKKDIYGNEVYTRQNMYAIKTSFDNYIKVSGNENVINCSEGGLGIERVPNRNFKEVIEEYCNKNLEIQKVIAKYDNKEKVIHFYHSIIKQTEEFGDIFKKIIELTDKMQEVIDKQEHDSNILELNEQVKEHQAVIDESELYYKWLLPICNFKLDAIDIEYQKEDYLKETEHEKQQMFIKYMKRQYEALQQMNQFLNETVSNILKEDQQLDE